MREAKDEGCVPTKQDIKQLIFDRCNPAEWIVCQEKHEDGSTHFHAAWRCAGKMDIKNAQEKFTIAGVKPSLEKPRKWEASVAYCEKDGDYIRSEVTFSRTNFRREYADHQAYEAYLEYERCSDRVFPFQLPDHSTQDEPGPGDKKCNWCIIAPPDSGKSRWAGETFEGKRVFYPHSGNEYAWEGYRGERIIIYDDWYPTRTELTRATGYYYHRLHVPSKTRYVRTYLPIKQRLCIIILHNQLPNYAHPSTAAFDNGWFHARFSIINVECFEFEPSE